MKRTTTELVKLVFIASVAAAMTFVLDNRAFRKELATIQEYNTACEQRCVESKKKLEKQIEMNRALVRQITRLSRVAAMVQPPVKTRLVQKKDVKTNLVTIPPQPEKFDMFENYIELKPSPHFAERQIDKTRWDAIWKCTCPLTCDCWVGGKCSTHGCRAPH